MTPTAATAQRKARGGARWGSRGAPTLLDKTKALEKTLIERHSALRWHSALGKHSFHGKRAAHVGERALVRFQLAHRVVRSMQLSQRAG